MGEEASATGRKRHRNGPYVNVKRNGLKANKIPSPLLLNLIRMAVRKEIRLFLLFAWLLCIGNSLNWQGTGNFTESNMTLIWNYIKANLNTSKTFLQLTDQDPFYLMDFGQGLSEQLNKQWDKAWNVIVVYIGEKTNADTVVYGYAFRSHWLWYNGYKMNDDYFVSFVIWKDYNCNGSFRQVYLPPTQELSSLNTTIYQAIYNIVAAKKSTINLLDVWGAARSYAQALESDPVFPNSAFTTIVSQTKAAYFSGSYCSSMGISSTGIDAKSNGRAFFLKMR